MSPSRYLICIAVSAALHAAFWLHAPVQPAFAMSSSDVPHTMALRLMATPVAPATAKPVSEDKPLKTKDEPLPAPKQEPVTEAQPKRKSEPTPEPKPEAKSQPKSEPLKAPKPELTPKPNALANTSDTPSAPAKHAKALKQPHATTEATTPPAHVETAAETASPVMVEKPSFRVKPVAPRYPRVAKLKGQQGVVMVEIWLDAQGRQTRLEIVASSGFETLDQAALTAVKGWQFNGHSINGHAIASRLKVPVRFELN